MRVREKGTIRRHEKLMLWAFFFAKEKEAILHKNKLSLITSGGVTQ